MVSQSTALGKRSQSSALMAPPPAPKRIQRPTVVLDEDTYILAVSHIIRRDFFPGLAETHAQSEYLNAVESKNKAWIREAGKKLTQVMTPRPHGRPTVAAQTRVPGAKAAPDRTPSTWGAGTPDTVSQTPSSAWDADEELGKLDSVDLNLSLGAFQAKYISEDQESFSQIIDKQNKAKFDKMAWARQGNMYASKQRIAQQKLLEASAANTKSEETALVFRPSQDLDLRPAAPTYHKHTAINSLMFAPDGVEHWAPTRAQVAEAASLAPPKQVLYNNTRLSAQITEPARPPSPTLSAVRDAVAGRPRLQPSEGGYDGSETPRVNGYAFVDAQPPDPEEDDDEDAPTNLLEKFGVDSHTTTPSFIIHDASAREKMHHRMVDKIGSSRSASNSNHNSHSRGPVKKPGAGLGIFTSETPRFLSAPTPARLHGAQQTPGRKTKGDLTPAAQRLFENMGTRVAKGAAGEAAFGRRTGKAWTPTPRLQRRM